MQKYLGILSIFLSSVVCFATEPNYSCIKPQQFYDGSFLAPLTTVKAEALRQQISSQKDKRNTRSAHMQLIAHGDTTAMVDWANILIEDCKKGVKANQICLKLSEAMAWDMLAIQKNWLDGNVNANWMAIESINNLPTADEIKISGKVSSILLSLTEKSITFGLQGMIFNWVYNNENHIKLCLQLLDGNYDPFVSGAEREKKFFWFCKHLTDEETRQKLTEGVWERYQKDRKKQQLPEIIFQLHKIIPSHYSALAVGRLFHTGALGEKLQRKARLLEALKYYDISNATGAAEHIADLYVEGISAEKLSQQQLDLIAERLYLEANTPEAKCSLARLYIKGRAGVKLTKIQERQDHIIGLLQQSGTPEAQYLLGTVLESQAKSKNDMTLIDEAIKLYQKSDSPDSLCALGRLCWQGHFGKDLTEEKKEQLSLNYLNKAGTSEANYFIGAIYEAKAKKSIEESIHNYTVAAQCYEKSATPKALCALGKLYEDGNYGSHYGRTKRLQEAFKLYEKSGTPKAKFLIGMMHKSGRRNPQMLAEKRYELAYQYFKESKTRGAYHVMAAMIYKKLVEKHLSDTERFDTAKRLFQKANTEESNFMLGWILIHHDESNINNHLEAIRYFENMTSSDKNFGMALLYLKSPLYKEMDSLERYNKVLVLLDTQFTSNLNNQAVILISEVKKLIIEEEQNRASQNECKGKEECDEPSDHESKEQPAHTSEVPEEIPLMTTKSSPKISLRKEHKEIKKQNHILRHKKRIQEMTASLGILPGAHSHVVGLPIVFLNATVEKHYNAFDTNPLTSAKLNHLINDIQFYGHELYGEGQPEILRNNQMGLRSRRINDFDRITYKVEADKIVIHSCGGHY